MPKQTIVYATCSATCEIVTLTLDLVSGKLAERSRTVVPNGGNQLAGAMPLGFSNDKRFLYASLRTPPIQFSTYAIDAVTGALSHLRRTELGGSPAVMTPDRAGRFLLAVSYTDDVLTVNRIGGDGAVGETVQIVKTPSHPHGLAVNPANRLVYVPCMADAVILTYGFDAKSGKLTEKPLMSSPRRPGGGAKLIIYDHQDKWLYALNEYDATVDVLTADPKTGELTTIQSVSSLPEDMAGGPERPLPPPRPGIGAGALLLSPDGSLLFTSDRPTISLSMFGVDSQTGRLTPLATAAGEPIPRGAAVDPTGKFLLCNGLQSGSIAVYDIDAPKRALRRRSDLKIGPTVDWIELISVG